MPERTTFISIPNYPNSNQIKSGVSVRVGNFRFWFRRPQTYKQEPAEEEQREDGGQRPDDFEQMCAQPIQHLAHFFVKKIRQRAPEIIPDQPGDQNDQRE
jgi:hypothetical protein